MMNTDKYTKIVLTVIAVNLTLLTLTNLDFVPRVHASDASNGIATSSSAEFGLVPLNKEGVLEVRLLDHNQIDVNVVGINTNDELDINIDEIGGGYVSHGGPISVEVK